MGERRSLRRALVDVRRRWSDVALAAGGVVVLVGSMLAADRASISSVEVDAFRLVNDLPGAAYPVVWPLMQFGTFISVPICTALALAFRRWRLAIILALSGVGVYVLAKVVKGFVDRGRPGALLDEVDLRGIGSGGRGFPSGHAAVSAAIATAVYPYLPPLWRRIAIGLAVVVSLARVYVGGHLPLDSIGGAALGIAVSSLLHFVLGVPAKRHSAGEPATEPTRRV